MTYALDIGRNIMIIALYNLTPHRHLNSGVSRINICDWIYHLSFESGRTTLDTLKKIERQKGDGERGLGLYSIHECIAISFSTV